MTKHRSHRKLWQRRPLAESLLFASSAACARQLRATPQTVKTCAASLHCTPSTRTKASTGPKPIEGSDRAEILQKLYQTLRPPTLQSSIATLRRAGPVPDPRKKALDTVSSLLVKESERQVTGDSGEKSSQSKDDSIVVNAAAPGPKLRTAHKHIPKIASTNDSRLAEIPNLSKSPAMARTLRQHLATLDNTLNWKKEKTGNSPESGKATSSLLQILHPNAAAEASSKMVPRPSEIAISILGENNDERDPDVMFANMERLFKGERLPYFANSDWRSMLRTLSLSSDKEIAKERIITALSWKFSSGAQIVSQDVVLLATFTASDRRSAEDAEIFLDDLKEQLKIDHDAAIHIQLIYGLVKTVGGEEAGRFIRKSQAHPHRRLKWQNPVHTTEVLRGVYEEWCREHRQSRAASSYDAMEALESSTEQVMRVLTHVLKDIRKRLLKPSAIDLTKEYNWIARVVRHSTRSQDDAVLFLRRMMAEGYDPDMETYDILADHLIYHGQFNAAMEILNTGKARGFKPNLDSMRLKLTAIAEVGKVPHAWKLWTQLSGHLRLKLLENEQFVRVWFRALLRWRKFDKDDNGTMFMLKGLPYIDGALQVAESMLAYQRIPPREVNLAMITELNDQDPVSGWRKAVRYHEQVKEAMLRRPAAELAQYAPDSHPLGHLNHAKIIGFCVDHKDIATAREVYAGMEDLRVSPNISTLTPIVRYYAKLGMHDEVFQFVKHLFESGMKPDVVFFTMVIDCMMSAGRVEATMQVLQSMEEWGVKPTDYTYNVVIRELVRKGDLRLAEEVKASMAAAGDLPISSYTENSILIGYVNRGDVDGAFRQLNKMEDAGTLDRVSYHTVLPMLIQKQDLATAEAFFEKMKKSKLSKMRPDVVTYNIMIRGYLSANSPARAMELFSSMPNRSTVTYTHIIEHYANAGDFAAAERYFDQALRKLDKNEVDSGGFSILVTRLARDTGSFTDVKRIVDKYLNRGGRLSGHGFSAIISAAMSIGKFAYALPYIRRAAMEVSSSTGGHSVLMNSVLDWYVKQRNVADMERVAGEMARGEWDGRNPIRATSETAAISSLTEPQLQEFLSNLPRSNTHNATDQVRLTANTTVLTTMMNGYGYTHNWRHALVVFKYLQTHRLPSEGDVRMPPTSAAAIEKFGFHPAAVSVIIDALGFSRQNEQVDELWATLLEDNYPLDTNNWTSLIEAKLRSGRFEHVVTLLTAPDPHPTFTVDVKTLRNAVSLARHAARYTIDHDTTHNTAATTTTPALLGAAYEARLWTVIQDTYPHLLHKVRASIDGAKTTMDAREALLEDGTVPLVMTPAADDDGGGGDGAAPLGAAEEFEPHGALPEDRIREPLPLHSRPVVTARRPKPVDRHMLPGWRARGAAASSAPPPHAPAAEAAASSPSVASSAPPPPPRGDEPA
ncbi:hypothetical protein DFJ77DRAFT_457287 [Powellomyces hirtus]|nr:hypothetical protein DFJ77DRAFT_457287 [Powellomyces hirtus]